MFSDFIFFATLHSSALAFGGVPCWSQKECLEWVKLGTGPICRKKSDFSQICTSAESNTMIGCMCGHQIDDKAKACSLFDTRNCNANNRCVMKTDDKLSCDDEVDASKCVCTAQDTGVGCSKTLQVCGSLDTCVMNSSDSECTEYGTSDQCHCKKDEDKQRAAEQAIATHNAAVAANAKAAEDAAKLAKLLKEEKEIAQKKAKEEAAKVEALAAEEERQRTAEATRRTAEAKKAAAAAEELFRAEAEKERKAKLEVERLQREEERLAKQQLEKERKEAGEITARQAKILKLIAEETKKPPIPTTEKALAVLNASKVEIKKLEIRKQAEVKEASQTLDKILVKNGSDVVTPGSDVVTPGSDVVTPTSGAFSYGFVSAAVVCLVFL